jgi:hypothetical protein
MCGGSRYDLRSLFSAKACAAPLRAAILIDPGHDHQGGLLQHSGIAALFARHGHAPAEPSRDRSRRAHRSSICTSAGIAMTRQ